MNKLPNENQAHLKEYHPVLVQEYEGYKILRMGKRILKSADDFIKIIEKEGPQVKEDESFNTLDLMRNYLDGEEVGKILSWLDKLVFRNLIFTANNIEEFAFVKNDVSRYKNVQQLILSRNKLEKIDI